MQTAYCHAHQGRAVYVLKEAPKPTVEGLPQGSLILRTAAASICGTDLFGTNEETGRDAIGFLDTFSGCCGGSGHEILGEVVDVVEPSKFHKGQLLLAMAPLYIRGMKTLRVRFESYTATSPTALPDNGGFAEFFVSHECCCVPVPDHHPLDNRLYFVVAQPLGTIIHALNMLNQSVLGKNVAVVGQGPNGLIMTQMLANMGARRIIALDLLPERLRVSRTCGATSVIHITDKTSIESYTEKVGELTNGSMCDVVVEMVGHQGRTFDLACELTRDKGAVLLFGLLTMKGSTIQARHFNRNLRFYCSSAPDFEDFEMAMELIQQGRFDPAPLFSHTFGFSDFPEAYKTASEYKDGVVKVLLTFDAEKSNGTNAPH